MSYSRGVHLVAAGAVVVGLVLGGCSDDGGGGEEASTDEYCAAVSEAYDLTGRVLTGETTEAELGSEFPPILSRLLDTAPPEIVAKYGQAFINGDPYANDDVMQYNEDTCGLEPPTPPASGP